MLAKFLFEQRGHHRITIDPATANEQAIRSYAKLGFWPVGVMSQHGCSGKADARPAQTAPAATAARSGLAVAAHAVVHRSQTHALRLAIPDAGWRVIRAARRPSRRRGIELTVMA